jgi:ribosomal protein S18 acetylase RimI-like enzyme
MAGADRDDRLREAAANRGLKLVKSRIRTPGRGDYGRYGLEDPSGKQLLGFGQGGLTATPEEIEAYLHKGAESDWKSSLKAAGARVPRRKKAEPEPEPEPPPLSIRPARPADAEAIARLVSGLGFEAGADAISRRLPALRKEPPLVAEQGGVVGVLTWHVTPVLHRPKPVGRITMMAVAEAERRHGVGRALVDEACRRMRAKGCGLVEVTSNVDLSGAHTFYRRLGFERTSYRFAKTI